MKYCIVAGIFATAALVVASGMAGEGLKSGPQAGEPLGGPFNVLNCTGKNTGKSNCLV